MENTKRNPAGQALFQMQFAIMMMNCGRIEEANTAIKKAETLLTDLEKTIDGVKLALEN